LHLNLRVLRKIFWLILSQLVAAEALEIEGHMQNFQAIPATHDILSMPSASLRVTGKARKPRSLPPPDQRSWLLLTEAASLIGCSKATAHRLRRGEIEGVPRLPSVQVGKRKWVVLKASLEQWQRENERISAA
jgi:hypothetical protein